MPIKYNLTKHDILADKIRKLSQRTSTVKPGQRVSSSLSNEEKTLHAAAVLVASFSKSHSWKTANCMTNGGVMGLNSSELGEIAAEHMAARESKWKNVRNTDIQEVAEMNIRDPAFYGWLNYAVADKSCYDAYKTAWRDLNREFEEECDNVAVSRE
ncbi:MAG: hypothetical protein KGH60_03435 [Candidatus Micrarchaeota archaeon]|nr:hypothetical protein [Candidatus Micrarchaeota archaeon]